MHIHIAGLTIADDKTLAAIKAAAKEGGIEVVSTFGTNVSRLWDEARTKFPALVADIEKGIADLKDSTLSGGDKAVKVATDVLATAPDVIAALPSAKDFLMHGVTEVFAATVKSAVGDLEAAAGALLGKL